MNELILRLRSFQSLSTHTLRVCGAIRSHVNDFRAYMDIIRDGTMGLERSSVKYDHVAGAVKIRYLHPFMLPFTWQLVWGVLGAHAQSQTEGTRPKRPTTPPAHTRGARPAWPHRGWRISHARHFSGARGARHG